MKPTHDVEEARALRMLQASTKDHRMKIIRDEGLYRHVRFQEPGTSIWHWDLVTWPGHLVITGDLQDFHFARISDMFEFFRGPVGRINPSYWAEKLCGHRQQYQSYSPEVFKRQVYEYFRDWCEWHEGPHRPLWRAIREMLTYDEIEDETLARQSLQNFRFDHLVDRVRAAQEEFVPQRDQDFKPQLIPKVRRRRSSDTFEFTDSWEWDLYEYDYHFLMSLHAIVWGINRYDEARRRSPWVSYDQWAVVAAEE